ncbi:MAG TPA: hypothetical protein VFY76_17645 [Nocardioides sp.]|nr:hypothetical protein [Nocardioides sp.]
MRSIRAAGSRLMATGVLSAGWYAILTGAVLIYLAWVLGSVAWSADRAAPFVAAACAATGIWQLQRGLRAELHRRPTPANRPTEGPDG